MVQIVCQVNSGKHVAFQDHLAVIGFCIYSIAFDIILLPDHQARFSNLKTLKRWRDKVEEEVVGEDEAEEVDEDGEEDWDGGHSLGLHQTVVTVTTNQWTQPIA